MSFSLPESLCKSTPWKTCANAMWLASTLEVRRNIEKFLFPSKEIATQLDQITSWLSQQWENSSALKEGKVFLSKDLSHEQRDFIFEHYLCLEPISHNGAGVGIGVEGENRFLALFEQDDHLRLRLTSFDQKVLDLWKSLSEKIKIFEEKFAWASDEDFGYLTSNLKCCGAALTATCFLHLPALNITGMLDETLSKENEKQEAGPERLCKIEKLPGNLVLISNRASLGLSEEAILRSVHVLASKLCAAEKLQLTKLQENKDLKVIDAIARAYGLIAHSVNLDLKETLDALSLVRLGSQLSLISGMNDEEWIDLFFESRRAHLRTQVKNVSEEDIAKTRAKFLHDNLKKTSLKTD